MEERDGPPHDMALITRHGRWISFPSDLICSQPFLVSPKIPHVLWPSCDLRSNDIVWISADAFLCFHDAGSSYAEL